LKHIVEVPYSTANDLPENVRGQVASLLNSRLADAIDLQSQAKQAHWNVKGPHFIALHELFDDIHGAMIGYVDLLAERVAQLGGIAEGAVRTVAARSQLADYPHGIASGADHTSAMGSALAEFGRLMRRAITETDDWDDQASADICTEITRGVDKWLWFVEAHGQSRTRTALTLESTGGAP
jgi:starvation-inducible DNA-binding protein